MHTDDSWTYNNAWDYLGTVYWKECELYTEQNTVRKTEILKKRWFSRVIQLEPERLSFECEIQLKPKN